MILVMAQFINMRSINFPIDPNHEAVIRIFSPLLKSFNMFGNISLEEIEDVLHSQLLGRIGCHADNITYIVPISYAYDGKYIYAHTQEGMKVDIMRKNPQVCFEVENMSNMGNWKSVICWGEFEEVTQEADRQKALEKLQERILPSFPSATTKLSPSWPFRSVN